jgi:hypothetical protein
MLEGEGVLSRRCFDEKYGPFIHPRCTTPPSSGASVLPAAVARDARGLRPIERLTKERRWPALQLARRGDRTGVAACGGDHHT